ncbi:hypothetical protein ACTXG6_34835 [Pseudonocardia sp. Cha107L01]|uniref:hypothetical protein n=1 Tax=Pseudonocardia sp. Cha107L01 TaxID=3457576 RepID=UPI00403E6C5E
MTTKAEGPGSRDPATAGAAGHGGQRTPIVWQVLSALLLLAMGGIHLALIFQWASGLLGVLFGLNAIGGLVLAIAMLAARRRLLRLASSLSLLFMAGTLLALVLALTAGPFGITERLSTPLVVPTLVVESIGTVVLAITTALMFRMRRED